MNGPALVNRLRALPEPARMALAGAVTGLSFPPLPLGFLAWVGLVPLIRAWDREQSPGRAALQGWYWSLGYLLVTLYWLSFNTGTTPLPAFMSMLGIVGLLSVNYLIIGGWFGWLRRHWGPAALWLLPVVWVAVEYVRTYGSLGFPWVALANTQTDYLLPMQNAAITGIYGISFWVVLLNILLLELLRSRDRRLPALLLALALLLPWGTGWLLLPPIQPGSLRVAVIQPNVNAAEKWNPDLRQRIFAQLHNMTRAVAVDSPDVVFWPEAAAPTYLRRGGRRYLRDIQQLAADIRAPVVTGMPDFERLSRDEVRYYNSIGYIDSTGLRATYEKIRLVPFAERMPPLFGWLKIIDLLGIKLGEFASGESYTVFEAGGATFSVGICLETTFPDVYRHFARAGAGFLVGAVNDGWYNNGLSSGPYQHAAQFRYRAIELRRPVLRVANTGISMVVDSGGRVTRQLALNQEGSFSVDIAPSTRPTFYSRFGDVFAWLNLLVGLSLSAWTLWLHLRPAK